VIVGGGTAGWMAAAYLSRALETDVHIQVVESEDISTIGVGEATFSTIQLFFQYLGLREEDWMPHCNATYKMAIKFVDWNAERRHFYHPFQRLEIANGRPLAEWWLKAGGPLGRFDYDCFLVPALCDAQRSPRFFDGRVFDSKVQPYLTTPMNERASSLDELQIQYPYAYHFDAKLIAQFLSGYAQQRGVGRTVDEVQSVQLRPDGFIDHIMTKKRGAIAGDLFIDCTGFRGLLINRALSEPFISFSDSLLCDSAIAMSTPSDPIVEGLNPFTQATALSAGWAWKIPLFHRNGNGYVYSSAFLENDAAEREFRHYLGQGAEGCAAHHIKMRIGRNRRSWVKNCVAIGLASGFVEPLESTGIFFIQHAIEQLVAHFPNMSFDPSVT